MLAINNCSSQSTKKTPYEMVFGQSVRHNHDFWEELHKQSKIDSVVDEEDLVESIPNESNVFNIPITRFLIELIFFFFYQMNDESLTSVNEQSSIPKLSSAICENENQE
jgi:hypothetical protein